MPASSPGTPPKRASKLPHSKPLRDLPRGGRNRTFSPVQVLFLGLGAFLALFLAGCAPSQLIANRLARAPRAHPQWLAPTPKVYYGYQPQATDGLQIEATTIPTASDTRGRLAGDPVRLAWRVVPPAAYGLTFGSSNWASGSRAVRQFDFRRQIPAPPLPGNPAPLGTVILLHGYGMDHESLLPWAFWLGERGWQAILVDLRGHGRSTGRWLGFGTAETGELTSLLHRLQSEGRVRGPVLAFGVSYGAAIALRWTATEPAIKAAVAIAPYARLADAVEGIRSEFAPWVPARLVRSGVRALPRYLDVPATALDPIKSPTRPSARILFVAGEDDVVARPEAVEELFRHWGKSARLLTVGGSAHEDLPFRFPEIAPALDSWLEGFRTPTPEGRSSP